MARIAMSVASDAMLKYDGIPPFGSRLINVVPTPESSRSRTQHAPPRRPSAPDCLSTPIHKCKNRKNVRACAPGPNRKCTMLLLFDNSYVKHDESSAHYALPMPPTPTHVFTSTTPGAIATPYASPWSRTCTSSPRDSLISFGVSTQVSQRTLREIHDSSAAMSAPRLKTLLPKGESTVMDPPNLRNTCCRTSSMSSAVRYKSRGFLSST